MAHRTCSTHHIDGNSDHCGLPAISHRNARRYDGIHAPGDDERTAQEEEIKKKKRKKK
jgi:hypothetical protein